MLVTGPSLEDAETTIADRLHSGGEGENASCPVACHMWSGETKLTYYPYQSRPFEYGKAMHVLSGLFDCNYGNVDTGGSNGKVAILPLPPD